MGTDGRTVKNTLSELAGVAWAHGNSLIHHRGRGQARPFMPRWRKPTAWSGSSESPLSIFEAREHIGETLGECHLAFRLSISPVLAREGVRTVGRAVRLQKQSTEMYIAALSPQMRFRLVGVDACHPVTERGATRPCHKALSRSGVLSLIPDVRLGYTPNGHLRLASSSNARLQSREYDRRRTRTPAQHGGPGARGPVRGGPQVAFGIAAENTGAQDGDQGRAGGLRSQALASAA